jgi:hypothetical protein
MGDRVKNSIKKSHNSKKIHVYIQYPEHIYQEERIYSRTSLIRTNRDFQKSCPD